MRMFVFYLSLGLVWVCEIEISHMGKNNGNPDLVCENTRWVSFDIKFTRQDFENAYWQREAC